MVLGSADHSGAGHEPPHSGETIGMAKGDNGPRRDQRRLPDPCRVFREGVVPAFRSVGEAGADEILSDNQFLFLCHCLS